MQGALPSILNDTPAEFFQRTRDILSDNVDLVCSELANVPGVSAVRAQGAMYMMVKIDARSFPKFGGDDLEFVQALISEESLYCLPGSAFYYPGAIRFVMTHSRDSMKEASQRLRSFCLRHYTPVSAETSRPKSIVSLPKGKTDKFTKFTKLSATKNSKLMLSSGFSNAPKHLTVEAQ